MNRIAATICCAVLLTGCAASNAYTPGAAATSNAPELVEDADDLPVILGALEKTRERLDDQERWLNQLRQRTRATTDAR